MRSTVSSEHLNEQYEKSINDAKQKIPMLYKASDKFGPKDILEKLLKLELLDKTQENEEKIKLKKDKTIEEGMEWVLEMLKNNDTDLDFDRKLTQRVQLQLGSLDNGHKKDVKDKLVRYFLLMNYLKV